MTDAPEPMSQRGGCGDHNLLRGFVWCAICDRLMTPVLASTGTRQYGCPDRECPRSLIPAERAERLVWDHFAYLNRETADQVAPEARREALRKVMRKVWIGKEVHDLYYEWHD